MKLAIGLYDGFTALDFVGPYQVLVNRPDTQVVLCAAQAGEVPDDMGNLRLRVDHTFAEVTDPDIVLIPGGFVTRQIAEDGHPIVEWVRTVHEGTTWTTSVCTGALVLGAAGVLDGLDATTHWIAYDDLASYGARPTEQRVVTSGKVVTAVGVSAGIDMALTLVDLMDGPEVSQAIQLGIEYDPQPPHDAGAPSKAPPEIKELVQSLMQG